MAALRGGGPSRLAFKICQLEGKHMSEKEMRQMIIRCHGAWGGGEETTYRCDEYENFVWHKRMVLPLKLCWTGKPK